MSWWNNWYVSFLSWRVRHIKERNFIVILSLLVGIITGLAGVFLKNSVHYTHQFLTERLQIDSGSLLFFILPFIGIWLTSLFVRYFVREDISHVWSSEFSGWGSVILPIHLVPLRPKRRKRNNLAILYTICPWKAKNFS